jgi:hypothetical protein
MAETSSLIDSLFFLLGVAILCFLYVRSRYPNAKHPHFIGDNFLSCEEVTTALRKNGLERCELVIGEIIFSSFRPREMQMFAQHTQATPKTQLFSFFCFDKRS